ncbi:MAG: alpha/beta hydrolase [Gammaproteobacteria bacterium]|nr:alpha/beta hydrolase [Gammaproteobacteria bacterium]
MLVFAHAEVYAAEPCGFANTSIREAETNDFFLCGAELPETVQIRFDDAGVTLEYLHSLEKCAPGDDRPGFHIALKANKGTGQVEVGFADPSTGSSLCRSTVTLLPKRDEPEAAWLNAMPPGAARVIDVQGIETRYFDFGEGPPLLLVHGGQAGGSNNSAEKWEQNVPGLAEHFRVIALDRLAQAGTANLPLADDYADYFARDAEHLEAFVVALGLNDLALVGHSQGGWPVTALALNRPELVDCLVNVDTVMVPDDMTLMRQALSFLMYESGFVHPPEGPTFYSARRSIALRSPSGNNITPEKAQRVVDQFNSPKTGIARDHMAAARMTPLHPSFQALKQEAYDRIAAGGLSARNLVIWGGKDPQVPLGLGELFNEMLVQAGVSTTLEVMPDAGHAPFIEFPVLFNDLIINYCGK